jgi:hypothetical protein
MPEYYQDDMASLRLSTLVTKLVDAGVNIKSESQDVTQAVYMYAPSSPLPFYDPDVAADVGDVRALEQPGICGPRVKNYS